MALKILLHTWLRLLRVIKCMFTSFCLFATKTEHKYKQADKKIRIAVEKRITSYIQDNNAVKRDKST